jgi:hypothetical protein
MNMRPRSVLVVGPQTKLTPSGYVDAVFANVRWEEVNRRYERARKAFEALRG